MDPAEITRLRQAMKPSERLEFDALVDGVEPIFKPNPGPQTEAFDSEADIVGFGGAAGGGKSYLASGIAVTQGLRSLVIRQEKVSTRKFVQEISGILGSRDGYSSQTSSWAFDNGDGIRRVVEFAGLENEGDEEKQQGVDYDRKLYDEVTQMREAQVRYTMGWVRSADPNQKCQVLMAFNPPTSPEGRWVVKFFAPWLDPKHANPAKFGELRWFATIGDNPDYELPVERKGAQFVVVAGKPVYNFDPADYTAEQIVTPKSRTFIQSRVTDNPYYVKSGYIAQLQALPEPLRSQMLRGDFMAGTDDHRNQVIPTAWVEAAMDRWSNRDARGEMTSMGVDAARGGNMGSTLGATGKDKMVIARRHGKWFAPLIRIKGVDVNSGSLAAAQVIRYRKDNAPVHLDVVGIGTSPYDFLCEAAVHVEPVNGAASAGEETAARGLLRFVNLRAKLIWRLREALDPENPDPIYLPDDTKLLADLTAPLFWVTKGGIKVESKDEIAKRLMRSTDDGDAVMYANIETPKRRVLVGGLAMTREQLLANSATKSYDDSRMDELKG
jgi:hypothetical protein